MTPSSLVWIFLCVGLLALAPDKRSFCQDCNKNGTLDSLDLQRGNSLDCNKNGVPDECDLKAPELSFSAAVSLSLGPDAGPHFIAAGDFDGDGLVDLSTANPPSGTASLIWNEGQRTFSDPVTFMIGGQPNSLAAGDFDQDGRLDIALLNEDKGVLLLKNQGGRVLVAGAPVRTGIAPLLLVALDVDRDGDLDLAAVNSSFDVSIVLNNGSGAFLLTRSFPVGAGPESLVASDLNGDGFPDLVTANDISRDVSVLLNKRDGSFEPQQRIAVGNVSLVGVSSADFDLDGDMDLAVVGGRKIWILKNFGDAIFTVAPAPASAADFAFVTAADLDEDGDPDLAVLDTTHALVMFQNDGHGLLSESAKVAAGQSPHAVTFADLDGDRHVDGAVVNAGSDDVTLHFDRKTPTSEDINSNGIPDECEVPRKFRRGDLDVSGEVDMADPILLLFHLFAAGPRLQCESAADADDNGKLDVSDVIAVLGYLFLSERPLPPPLGECGFDPLDGAGLSCGRYDPCE